MQRYREKHNLNYAAGTHHGKNPLKTKTPNFDKINLKFKQTRKSNSDLIWVIFSLSFRQYNGANIK